LVAIILGLSIRHAASRGMVGSALLTDHAGSSESSAAIQAPKDHDSLFVSEDEDETGTPQIQINEIHQEEGDIEGSLSPASNFDTISKEVSQQTASSMSPYLPTKEQTMPSPQQPFPPNEPKQKFSSLFTAPTSIHLNPFTIMPSPKTDQPSHGHNLSSVAMEMGAPSSITGKPNPFSLPKMGGSITLHNQLQSKSLGIPSSSPKETTWPFSIAAAISNAAPPLSISPAKPVSIFESLKLNGMSQNKSVFSFSSPDKQPFVGFKFDHSPISSLEGPSKSETVGSLPETKGVTDPEPEGIGLSCYTLDNV
jgi:hypothetical protein